MARQVDWDDSAVRREDHMTDPSWIELDRANERRLRVRVAALAGFLAVVLVASAGAALIGRVG